MGNVIFSIDRIRQSNAPIRHLKSTSTNRAVASKLGCFPRAHHLKNSGLFLGVENAEVAEVFPHKPTHSAQSLTNRFL